MTKPKLRYQLIIGKYGFYFHDKELNVDLTLEMVLNKLNSYETRINKSYIHIGNLNKEIVNLKRDD